MSLGGPDPRVRPRRAVSVAVATGAMGEPEGPSSASSELGATPPPDGTAAIMADFQAINSRFDALDSRLSRMNERIDQQAIRLDGAGCRTRRGRMDV
ncbi:hypothetical protein NDU88_004591 [Pleurodeles waltl]|uniref:Uncharacterized protein n=1 Tax=Pleurodeles waltl TaxID=8319 RepID=A0AAV7TUQ9_PLEWA|nr:hypothetical protein NDU88_004591 [Pleurodeles waltl]